MMLLTINERQYRLRRLDSRNLTIEQQNVKGAWLTTGYYNSLPQLAHGLARIAGELEPLDSDDLTTAARDLLQRFDEAVIDLSYQLQRSDCIE